MLFKEYIEFDACGYIGQYFYGKSINNNFELGSWFEF